MPKITKAQRTALEAARDYGDANAYACPSNPRGYSVYPHRSTRFQMFRTMMRAGLLELVGCGHYGITDAGRAALEGK